MTSNNPKKEDAIRVGSARKNASAGQRSGPISGARLPEPPDRPEGGEQRSFGSAGSKPTGDGGGSRSLEWMHPTQRGFATSACLKWSESEATRRLKRRVSHANVGKALKGTRNPWEYRLSRLQQCTDTTRTRWWSKALKLRLKAGSGLFRKAAEGGGRTAGGQRDSVTNRGC